MGFFGPLSKSRSDKSGWLFSFCIYIPIFYPQKKFERVQFFSKKVYFCKK